MLGFPQFPFRWLDRWRLYLVVFAVVYGCILSIDLTYNSMLWDQVTHFTGGLLLSRGQVVTWVWTNSLYPPAYDTFTALYYLIAGPSVFAGRLVALTFSVLSLFAIYEIANRLYNAKTALLSAVLFSVMPGIVWLSRLAMIETMLIFTFSVSMLFFFSWLKTDRKRLGNQLSSICCRSRSEVPDACGCSHNHVPWHVLLEKRLPENRTQKLSEAPKLAAVVPAIAVVAVVIYALLISGVLSTLLFAVREGTEQKAVFSARYPEPISIS